MKPILSILTAAALAAMTLLCTAASERTGSAEECIRLHVIANSDSDEDQSVKLKVRDAILACARENFTASDREEAEAELMKMGGRFDASVSETLSENGADYGAQLVFGEFDFPDREYAGRLYPAGKYRALRVVLGNGEGHNWWCVMFPPLCLIETEDEPAEFNEDGTLKFKSWVWDFIKEVFGL
ncbi:MAG: stage II sporulation protein R [Clostridiales bacterium]|nr:stage II sporulation protein R [Clostridiales bacterium]